MSPGNAKHAAQIFHSPLMSRRKSGNTVQTGSIFTGDQAQMRDQHVSGIIVISVAMRQRRRASNHHRGIE